MDKLDLILDKLNQIDNINNKLDKMGSDIILLKNDNKGINRKLDIIIKEKINL